MQAAKMRMLRWMCGHTKRDMIRNQEIPGEVRACEVEMHRCPSGRCETLAMVDADAGWDCPPLSFLAFASSSFDPTAKQVCSMFRHDPVDSSNGSERGPNLCRYFAMHEKGLRSKSGEAKTLGDFFPSVQVLVDGVTRYLCWWKVADTPWNKLRCGIASPRSTVLTKILSVYGWSVVAATNAFAPFQYLDIPANALLSPCYVARALPKDCRTRVDPPNMHYF
ncbi:hypothetical protein MTR67_001608 [Solanum verrucosum]|uniref:Uncharacterized protein n=1 Tax=Solanum verrucosum TaxID=315347 RepID=A0AAF0PNV6_SOLVR|nr:hypothetical protein MTR67_001608 [Solanum verrucosum]